MMFKNLIAVSATLALVGFSAERAEAAPKTIYSGGPTEIIFPLGAEMGEYASTLGSSAFSAATGTYTYSFSANGYLGSGTAGAATLEFEGSDPVGSITAGWYAEDNTEIDSDDVTLTSVGAFVVGSASVETEFAAGPKQLQQFRLSWTGGGSDSLSAQIKFKFGEAGQIEPVPEIDASAGMGSLAALGAMLAFYRSRRRSA